MSSVGGPSFAGGIGPSMPRPATDRSPVIETHALRKEFGATVAVGRSPAGIVVQDATVHISNSHIEGASASFQAEDRARMFVRGSTFQGVSRRAELATVQDQGGNRWR